MREKTIQVIEKEGLRFLEVPVEIPVQRLLEADHIPPLFEKVLQGANWLWRNENTVKFSVLSSDSSLIPQWLAILLAWNVEAVLDNGDTVPLTSLDGSMRSELTSLRIPLDVPGRIWGEASVTRTPSDTPIVSAVAVIDTSGGRVQSARVALTGVWKERARLAESADRLVGEALQAEHIEEVAAAVAEEVNPMENFLGSAEYRQEMASVLTRRALKKCMETGV